jgi:hypothetical protein
MKKLQFNTLMAILALISLTASADLSLAQEYDDLYFNGTDRKTVKLNKQARELSKAQTATGYKELSTNTEEFASKNVNPEYIARYKQPEESSENAETGRALSNEDYYVENFNLSPGYDSLLNSAKYNRDYTSAPRYNNSFFNPSLSFNSFYGMGPGSFWGPTMGMGIGMSWGMGSMNNPWMNPWNMGFGMGMPYGGFYDPWMMGYPAWGMPYGGFYDPWMYGSMYSMYSPWGMNRWHNPYRYGYGFGAPIIVVNNPDVNNGSLNYQPRTSRSSASPAPGARNLENRRIADPVADTRSRSSNMAATPTSGRVSRDYATTQNEFYNRNGQRSSAQRISTNPSSTADRYSRTSVPASSLNANRPVRSTASPSFNNSGTDYSRYNRSGSGTYSSPGYDRSRSSSFGNSYSPSGSSGSSFQRSSGSSSPSFAPSGGSSGSRMSSGSSGASRGGRQ